MMTIEKTSNGALVTHSDKEGKFVTKECYVFDEENVDHLADLLREVADQLVSSNRYAKQRIVIKLEHGDKFECKDVACTQCRRSDDDGK